jgi:hypothetical protein
VSRLVLALALAALPAAALAQGAPRGEPEAVPPAAPAAENAGEEGESGQSPAGDEGGDDDDAPLDDDEFEQDERPLPAIATGPIARGRLVVSGDVGWLRSGLRGAVGFGRGVDLLLRVESMLLYDGIDAQNSVELGLRYSPLGAGRVRVTGEVSAGQLFAQNEGFTGALTTVRGELALGVLVGPTTVYARGALRGVREEALVGNPWVRDGELGLGVEGRLRRLVGGVEWYRWTRPDLETLDQWRLRVGFAL